MLDIMLIGFSLSMDAFSVAVCKGMSIEKRKNKNAIIIATFFGLFQAVMPIIGYIIGTRFEKIVQNTGHWIAFGMLTIIGINMIKDSFEPKKNIENSMNIKELFVLAFATSIDALVVGITFAFLNTNIILSSVIIGTITFIVSFLGVKIGNKFKVVFENNASIAGGVVLILIGLKILFENL